MILYATAIISVDILSIALAQSVSEDDNMTDSVSTEIARLQTEENMTESAANQISPNTTTATSNQSSGSTN
jgi:hypothetical protein